MLHKATIALSCAAAALLFTALPDAVAREEGPSRAVLKDRAGDVWRVNVRTSEWTKVGRLPAADVRRAVVSHRSHVVLGRMRFVNLRRVGWQSYDVGLTTPRAIFFATVTSTPRARAGRHALSDGPSGTPVTCSGLSHRIDYAADLMTVRVPRSCLAHPRWVRANLGNRLVLGERPHRRHYADNPHNRFPYSNFGTRRLYQP
jgi:hypothetical protein